MTGLRAARRKQHLSQESLGHLSGLNARTISEAERGLRNLSPSEQKRLVKVLGLDVNSIVFCTPCLRVDNSFEEFDPDFGDDWDEDDEDDEEEDDEDWD